MPSTDVNQALKHFGGGGGGWGAGVRADVNGEFVFCLFFLGGG